MQLVKDKPVSRKEYKKLYAQKMRDEGRAKPKTAEQAEKNRDRQYRERYGITLSEYNEMFAEQDGKCACCGEHQLEDKRRLAVDHCHDSGDVRGLLCFDCNIGIGKLGDNIEGIERALNYLRR